MTVLTDGRPAVELKQIHPGGVFEGEIADAELPLRYQLEVDYGDAGKFTIDDPYAFLPTIGELDLHLIAEGRHEELYDKLGAHVRDDGIPRHGPPVTGTAFAVWAPAARAVSVVGDFNSLGRPPARDALARRDRDLGAVPPRRRRGRALQVRDPDPRPASCC